MLVHLEYNPMKCLVKYVIYSYKDEKVINRVYSSDGTLIYENESHLQDGSTSGSINLSRFTKGIYYLYSDGLTNSTIQKIIIN